MPWSDSVIGFDPDAEPVVEVYRLDADGELADLVGHYTEGSGRDHIRVGTSDRGRHFIVVVRLRDLGLVKGEAARVVVWAKGGSRYLGAADVVLTSNGREARQLRAGEVFPVVGGALPVKFEIGEVPEGGDGPDPLESNDTPDTPSLGVGAYDANFHTVSDVDYHPFEVVVPPLPGSSFSYSLLSSEVPLSVSLYRRTPTGLTLQSEFNGTSGAFSWTSPTLHESGDEYVVRVSSGGPVARYQFAIDQHVEEATFEYVSEFIDVLDPVSPLVQRPYTEPEWFAIRAVNGQQLGFLFRGVGLDLSVFDLEGNLLAFSSGDRVATFVPLSDDRELGLDATVLVRVDATTIVSPDLLRDFDLGVGFPDADWGDQDGPGGVSCSDDEVFTQAVFTGTPAGTCLPAYSCASPLLQGGSYVVVAYDAIHGLVRYADASICVWPSGG